MDDITRRSERYTVKVMAPDYVSHNDLQRFVAAVEAGGEVEPAGLEVRIRRAAALAVVYVNGDPAGVAALKIPTPNHRATVADESGYDLSDCLYELGWIVIQPQYRGRKLSAMLARKLLEYAGDKAGVFCTVRADNLAIQLACKALGFVEVGERWQGTRGPLGLGIYQPSKVQPGFVSRILRRFI